MRYYKIDITQPSGGASIKSYTSQVNGTNDPGALNVEMDVLVAPFAQPFGDSYVRVWGIDLQTIGQASDLNFKNITVYGGMAKGLPLANPKQAGILFQGAIRQAFGNWQGTSQTLDLLVGATGGDPVAPQNIVFTWKKGQPMSAAIMATLAAAAPGFKLTINISPKLVFTEDVHGYYQSLTQFAQMIKNLSAQIIGSTYGGVDILINQNQFIVYDGTTQAAPKQIAFTDLIGQITWIGPGQISIKCVMRADILVGDYVKLPPGQIVTTAQSFSQYRNGSIFQGVFQVFSVRHVGNFRQPDGSAWVTVLTAGGPISAGAS